ncbi:DUF2244 domain-containing protein [Betaproteobacteria bacterium]|nr:DUF2244 domain-containing protein [Betaproteobacteria bacterium]
MAWTLKKNCVLSPLQFGMCLGFAGSVSLMIGLAWASMGFWLVFLFVLVECAVLLIAFFCYASHAADFEKVVLTEKEILFEFETAGKREIQKLPRFQVRARMTETGKGSLVEFSWGAKAVKVGKLVDLKSREKFFGEIKGYIC